MDYILKGWFLLLQFAFFGVNQSSLVSMLLNMYEHLQTNEDCRQDGSVSVLVFSILRNVVWKYLDVYISVPFSAMDITTLIEISMHQNIFSLSLWIPFLQL